MQRYQFMFSAGAQDDYTIIVARAANLDDARQIARKDINPKTKLLSTTRLADCKE